MHASEALKHETETLIEAIWGARPVDAPVLIDPEFRERQNQALAKAIRNYLQAYLDEI